MHTEYTRVLCSSTLVWCGLQVTCDDHEDNVRVLHVKFSCSCVQTRKFFKNTRVDLQNTRMLPTCMFEGRIELYCMCSLVMNLDLLDLPVMSSIYLKYLSINVCIIT